MESDVRFVGARCLREYGKASEASWRSRVYVDRVDGGDFDHGGVGCVAEHGDREDENERAGDVV